MNTLFHVDHCPSKMKYDCEFFLFRQHVDLGLSRFHTFVYSYLPSHFITMTQFQYILVIAFLCLGILNTLFVILGCVYLALMIVSVIVRRSTTLTYIYRDVDECWITSSMKRFKVQMSLNYANIKQNAFSWHVVAGHVSFKIVSVISFCSYHIL